MSGRNEVNDDVLVKADQHILEYPIWLLDERNDLKRYTCENEYGTFTLTCGERPPDATDQLYLLSIMKLSETQKRRKIRTKRGDILKLCGFTLGVKNYHRLMESMERWRNVGLNFNGCWFDGARRVQTIFGVIDWAELDKDTGELVITINEKFYEIMKASRYYRLIDIKEYRALRRPISRRLYELLMKRLGKSAGWECEAKKLAEKLTLKERYPSQIIKKLQPAIAEINKNTDFRVEMTTRKADDRRVIIRFQRLSTGMTRSQIKALKKTASECWQKLHGGCGTDWEHVHDRPNVLCHYCKKFGSARDMQPSLFEKSDAM
jgi:hypothetical protein